MRKLAISTFVAMLLVPGTALARSYRTGTYEQGPQSGFTAPGIHIDIAHGSFNVVRILMHETCTAPGRPTFNDYGGFQHAPGGGKLSGSITKRGKLSGIFRDGHGDYTKVKGHIKGRRLTVTGKEFSHYVPSGSTTSYTCNASGTFHPKRV